VKRAIVSDIHGNLEALEAVVEDIKTQNVDEVFCLGDVIGYGPNPCECIDRVMEFDLTILGNHDQGALFDPEGFSSGAERAIFWTRQQLESPDNGADASRLRWDFLCELPRSHRQDRALFVHGSARNPLNEYVFPEDIYNQRKIERIFSLIERFCFQGHTHVPGVFLDSGRFLTPSDVDFHYEFPVEGKMMVNVGSVGQPRDGDPRPCYVVFDETSVAFRRVEYSPDATAEKIYEIPQLDNFLGDRLREGR
jgi:predicted phosphodiesterase